MLSDFIKELTEQDTKSLSQKALKVCEETGELAKVILPFDNADGTLHRFVDKQRILEEIADVYLTSISIAYDLGFTDDEIEEMITTKAKKWAEIQIREAKVKDKIPFEIHVTVMAADNEEFKKNCKTLDVKPIVLALQTKDTTIKDVMTSSVHMGTNRSAYEEMKRISHGLAMAGYDVVREKIETVPWHPAAPTKLSDEMPKDCYFECHVGVNVPNTKRKDDLQRIVDLFDAHMSRNAFKVHSDGSWMQMVTVRWYKGTVEGFENNVDILYNFIWDGGFEVEKRITEFSIYDTKVSHDAEWLKK
jgi:NTP pyrophosphatase (non-canonical NTP hydrolase)